MKTRLLMSSVALAVVMTAGSALADKANDTLNAAFTKELESVDSYFNSAREGVILQRSIWDGLLYLNQETGEYEGNLATSWTWVDDTTLELKLREGVKFHNGEEFEPTTWSTRSSSFPSRRTASSPSATSTG